MGQMVYNYKKVVKGLGFKVRLGLGLGFRVRLGPGYIYRQYIHDLPHVPPLD